LLFHRLKISHKTGSKTMCRKRALVDIFMNSFSSCIPNHLKSNSNLN
jgi:hypothetical protein